MYRIVCFGDSNTWGYNPANKERFDENTRWTALLQKKLGDAYQVVECGICGRTTSFDDRYRDYHNGRRGLGYSLLENRPIDLLIISLGGNDMKYTNARGSARGLDALLAAAENTGTLDYAVPSVFRDERRILVISPIPFGPEIDDDRDSMFCGKYQDSLRFGELYKRICEKHGVRMLEGAAYAAPSQADHIHMDAENHRKMAEAVYEKVLEMLP